MPVLDYTPHRRPSLADLMSAVKSNVGSAAGGGTGLLQTLAAPGNTVLDYIQRLYRDADQTVRGTIEAAPALLNTLSGSSPVTPDEIVRQGVGQAIHDWTNPVEYANEHPAQFLLDLIGGTVGLSRLSRARGLDFASERGALGSVGQRLEAGDVGRIVIPPTSRRLSGASGPVTAEMQWPDLLGDVLLKPARAGMYDQASGDLDVSILNRNIGSPVRMPGMNLTTSPTLRESLASPFDEGRVTSGGSFVPPHMLMEEDLGTLARQPVLAIEYAEGARDIRGPEQLALGLDDPNLRRATLLDLVVGNVDRAWGHNTMADVAGQYLPVDYGLALSSTGPGGASRMGLHGERFTPDEFNMLELISDEFINNPYWRNRLGGDRQIARFLRYVTQLILKGKF